jgi:hypothetical protein
MWGKSYCGVIPARPTSSWLSKIRVEFLILPVVRTLLPAAPDGCTSSPQCPGSRESSGAAPVPRGCRLLDDAVPFERLNHRRGSN